MTHRFTIAVALVALAPLPTAAHAERLGPDGFLEGILARASRALEVASDARKPKPPVPVPVQWRARNRGSLSLGAPLLALETGDLDNDGTPELIGLTTTEIVILSTRKLGQVRARAALPAAFALVRSRDPVGTISVEGRQVAVRTSEQAVGGRYELVDGVLSMVGEQADFPLCAGITARLEPGRNVFDVKSLTVADGAWPAGVARPTRPFYGIECRAHIGSDGRPMRTITVTDESRVVSVSCEKAGDPCADDAVARAQIDAAGIGFEVADVDRDGRAEVIGSRGQAPGRPDRVRVFAVGKAGPRLTFSKSFSGGVIAISAVDLDADGSLEVVAAVRIVSSVRLNLWTLNRTRR